MAASNRKVILSMQMTLDGFLAGPNELDWLIGGDDEWVELFKDLESVDTFLLGRKMYPGYSGFWKGILADPQSQPDLLRFARLADKTTHILLSRTVKTADWQNTRIANDAAAEIARLKSEQGKDIMAWGGAELATNLVNQDLVDEFRISLNPTLLTKGKSLFGNVQERKRLSLIDSRPLESGLTILRYRAVK